jgi:predicted AAA+ superfamily ATPase
MDHGLTEMHKAAISDQIAASLLDEIPNGTERAVTGVIELPGKATAVIGMRRAGKTMFLHQRRRMHAASESRDAVPYLNFEDERLLGLTGSHLGVVVDEYRRLTAHLASERRPTWFLDEIQNVKGWERFVRRLLDEGNRVYVSGSSAAMLSREIATSLRGRAWEVSIYPFGFQEFLIHHEVHGTRAKTEKAFMDYLTVGGFPEAQSLDVATRRQLLTDYVDVAMLRDVVERHDVSNVSGLRWLVRHVLGNAGGAFSVEKFYASLKSQGLAISRDTVHALINHLEDCFLIRVVWMETSSERQRMVNPRKVYPIDQGLIPVFDRTGRSNIGHALETAVLVEALRRRCEVTYIKTTEGYEVDMLLREPSGATHLVQVCADASANETSEREIRALQEARALYREAIPWLLTVSRSGYAEAVPKGVRQITAYEWMLMPEWT